MNDDRTRDADPTSISSLMGEIMGGVERPQFSIQQKARMTWLECNGDLERRHTCGVYLAAAKKDDGLPVLVVYIDSSAIMQDFTTDHLLYVGRLDHAGLKVADVRFKLSHDKKTPTPQRKDAVTAAAGACEATHLPPLSKEEERDISSRVEELPDGLRDKVREAMRSSLRWGKSQETRNDKNTP